MSIEIWYQGFSAAGADGVSPHEVLHALGANVESDAFGFHRILCQEGECELSMTIENGVATAITIFRPCAGRDLSERLFSLLIAGPYVAFAPGSNLAAGNRDTQQYVPSEMLEALGPVRIVSNSEELSDALFAA